MTQLDDGRFDSPTNRTPITRDDDGRTPEERFLDRRDARHFSVPWRHKDHPTDEELRHLLTKQAPRRGPRSRVGKALLVLGWGFGFIALVGVGAYFTPMHSQYLLGLSALSPYLMLGAPLAGVCFALTRARTWLMVAAALTLIVGSLQAPLFIADDVPAGTAFRVMTANLHLGEVDAASLVSAVRNHKIDALMVQELTPEERDRLQAAGIDELLPYNLLAPFWGAAGAGLWSRYPLSDPTQVSGYTFKFLQARVKVPGVAKDPTLVAAHMAGPVPTSVDWEHDIDRLPGDLRDYEGTVIVGADLNATTSTAQFRRLLVNGFADASSQAGEGLLPTWPNDKPFTPAVITLDHVLTRQAVARSVDTINLPGSDHRGLLSTIVLPKS